MPMPTNITPDLTDEGKIAMNLITLNTAVNELQDDMKTLNKIVIVGNGELPLREVVRNHDVFIKDVKYWVRFIGGALVMQTIAFIVGIVVALVQFLPVLKQLANP